jgi:hypothetical protein
LMAPEKVPSTFLVKVPMVAMMKSPVLLGPRLPRPRWRSERSVRESAPQT